ncbi:ATP-dependent zinc metalloprotease FTSH, chloroplastic-like [Chenopodium quinoa]|uniref:ATP-dependent zinc metalloprotease FTSH, chloroplastic-like n=1 Tax=Chenopodium quinoa TaxID=63459 RepID=UPI000B792809|nr:ATP-dependent zinc metalloprotease FTSH, chloroplastic-like [Chenopodium quinoa]
MPKYDPVAKISIIPRGQAGGMTPFVPSEERLDQAFTSEPILENQMVVALGGRVAEEVIFDEDYVTKCFIHQMIWHGRPATSLASLFLISLWMTYR